MGWTVLNTATALLAIIVAVLTLWYIYTRRNR